MKFTSIKSLGLFLTDCSAFWMNPDLIYRKFAIVCDVEEALDQQI